MGHAHSSNQHTVSDEIRELCDPAEQAKGITVYSVLDVHSLRDTPLDDASQEVRGRILFSLDDMPLNQRFLTTSGRELVRISKDKAALAGVIFDMRSGQKDPTAANRAASAAEARAPLSASRRVMDFLTAVFSNSPSSDEDSDPACEGDSEDEVNTGIWKICVDGELHCVICGDRGVGKTTVLTTTTSKILDDVDEAAFHPIRHASWSPEYLTATFEYTHRYIPSAGSSRYPTECTKKRLLIVAQEIDEMHSYSARIEAYRSSNIFLIFFSLLDSRTLQSVPKWMEEIATLKSAAGSSQPVFVVVGTKAEWRKVHSGEKTLNVRDMVDMTELKERLAGWAPEHYCEVAPSNIHEVVELWRTVVAHQANELLVSSEKSMSVAKRTTKPVRNSGADVKGKQKLVVPPVEEVEEDLSTEFVEDVEL